jgi:hypothetical protein
MTCQCESLPGDARRASATADTARRHSAAKGLPTAVTQGRSIPGCAGGGPVRLLVGRAKSPRAAGGAYLPLGEVVSAEGANRARAASAAGFSLFFPRAGSSTGGVGIFFCIVARGGPSPFWRGRRCTYLQDFRPTPTGTRTCQRKGLLPSLFGAGRNLFDERGA